jgi:DNA-directed RNA polymerase specialized sigma subunit
MGARDMTAKEYLQQYRNADREINAKLDQIHRLRELATKTTSILTPDKVQTQSQNKTEIIVAKIVDLKREVDAEIDGLAKIKRRVENAINQVPDGKCRGVLKRRYINGKTWEQIAVAFNMSYFGVCKLHGRALPEFIKNNIRELIEVYSQSVI